MQKRFLLLVTGNGCSLLVLRSAVTRRGWLPGVQVLVTAGAKQGVRNKRGLTALAEALVGDHGPVADLLLKAGADPLAKAGRCGMP
jgi:hypothetical protein